MRGGLQLSAHKERVASAPLVRASVPETLTFHVACPRQERSEVLVSVSERVLLGQPLARCGATTLHASVSGIVQAINERQDGVEIDLHNDSRDERHSSVQPIRDYRKLAPAELLARVAAAGIVGLGGATFPTAAKLQLAFDRRAELLIINGAECEPYIACDDALMREYASEIVLGAQALLQASAAQRAIVAIESEQPQAIAAIRQALDDANDARLTLTVVRTYYPAGGERQLIALLTGKEVPTGKLPQDIGVLCQNVGTAAAVARLIKDGLPLIERIVTVTGGGVASANNLVARVGTPISSLIADCGGYAGPVERLIMGGSMMGVALPSDDVSITAATNCVIAAAADDLVKRGPEMPCIRCGECAEACPAALLPQQLLRYARLNDGAALTELGLRDCIECGCCDYVCPSDIPLTSVFVAAKNSP
jgi:Na+-translocating ferredoxin:NAD+ oxidoreductase subunit C